MLPLSRLPAAEVALLRRLVAPDALLSFYLSLAEAEAGRGEDASLVLVGQRRRGAALGARFDGIAVVSTTGALDEGDLHAVLRWPGRLELHLTAAHHARLRALAPHGLGAARRMLAMAAPAGGAADDPAAVLLDEAGFAEAATIMARHNPDTVLSRRMAALPFVAIREGGRIVAMAGTIGVARGTALVGHFLTVPEARGRGLARRLALTLRRHFAGCGVGRLLLATTEDNLPACRAYASAGFAVVARRLQVEAPGAA